MNRNDEAEFFDDLAFLQCARSWPNYPCCPVKRQDNTVPNGLVQLGTVVGLEEAEPTVYLVGMPRLMGSFLTIKEKDPLKKFNQIAYNSLEELVADGWLVD